MGRLNDNTNETVSNNDEPRSQLPPPPPPPPPQFLQSQVPQGSPSIYATVQSSPLKFNPQQANISQPVFHQPQMAQQTVAPPMGIPVPIGTEVWTTGLFDCMENPLNALVTFFFPCVTYGQIAEIIDKGQSSCVTNAILYTCILYFIGLPCLISYTLRTKLRYQYGLMESPAPDWLVHLCCDGCALCQEYRELQNRGCEPSIGWVGNVARSQQQVAMMPPTNQTMMG